MALRVEKPDSFKDFVGLIESLQGDETWYRGCGKSSYSLLPTLYRHKVCKTIDKLADLERGLMTRFRQRSIPFHDRTLQDDWDALFFMQHYHVPTRLLDWTENPFIGFYFAAMSAKPDILKTGSIKFTEDAAVWVLDAITWNRHALSHQSFDGTVLSSEDEALKGYKPTQTFAGMNKYPVALYGAHNSPRIVAQRGVFTIFGQNVEPMETTFAVASFPPNCLVKIILRRHLLEQMRSSILSHGITESVVFPDLEGLSQEIKRTFGFDE